MSDSPSLAPDTRLVRAPDITLKLTDDNVVRIEVGDEALLVSRIALLVLDAFARPHTVAEVLSRLPTVGAEDFIETSSVIVQLARAGLLRRPGEHRRETARGFVCPSIHIAMLADETRTSSFCRALRALVKPGDVVIDIGTGTGVLATCAAQAGARRVFAIEATAIADKAAEVFAQNGVSDRVELVREHSTRATVPERGTLLVTETIGNDPLDEHILEIVSDARQRLLTPNARVVPAKLEIVAIPTDIPQAFFERHVFTERLIRQYHDAYGIDFEPLLGHRLGTMQPISIKTADACSWPAVGPQTSLLTLDLENGQIPTTVSATAEMTLARDTARLGVFLAFRALLSPGVVLSTVPGEVSAKNAWRYELWPVFDHLASPVGTTFALSLEYRRGTSALRCEAC